MDIRDFGMMNEYMPVSCELHSSFELWIMHQMPLNMIWCDMDGIAHAGLVHAIDVRAELGEEFLYFKQVNSDETQCVRLDRIKNVESQV